MLNVEEQTKQQEDIIAGAIEAEVVDNAYQDALEHHSDCQDNACEKCKEINTAVANFERENRKEIIVTALPDQTREKLKEVLDALNALQQEVMFKQAQAIEKNQQIKTRVKVLVESGKVQIDQEEFTRSEASVVRYAEVLYKIIFEVERERGFVDMLLSKEPGTTFQAWKRDSDNFEEYVKGRIKLIKQYVKTVKKNVSVSFSRYCFGFDAQEQRIGYIESLVRNAQHKQPQEKQINP